MHQPLAFRLEDRAAQLELIHNFPLATMVHVVAGVARAEHVPLFHERDANALGRLQGHVARANPLWREVSGKVLTVFQAASHYITPNWYPSKAEHGAVVPTWNYAVVHATGTLRWREDPAWLRDLVDRQVARFEAAQQAASGEPLAHQPWRVSDAPADYIAKQLRAIVGLEIELTLIEGKAKLSQNRTAGDRAGVVAGLHGQDTPAAHEMAARIQAASDQA